MSDMFDFGFTAVSENEVSEEEKQALVSAATENLDRAVRLLNQIKPLLENLKKNPEKEYILWPDRVEKIEEFQKILNKIVYDE